MLSGVISARLNQNAVRRVMDLNRQHESAQTLFQKFSHVWTPAATRSQSQTAMALFSYRIGASSCGKKTSLRAPENGKNQFNSSLLNKDLPFFSSIPKFSGEDAFFMAHIAKSRRYLAFGIADGVGGWTQSGVDPGKFSHGLCRYMADKTTRPEDMEDLRPQKLLQYGYDQVQADPKIEAGGSTAVIATAAPNGDVEVANLGDSGFLILQPNKVAFKSAAQTHAFNTPYQLSKLTPRMIAQNKIFGNSAAISESPANADVIKHQAKHGDVFVFASDGVWDNLSPMDTLNIIAPMMEKGGYWSTSKTSGSSEVNNEALRPSNADKDALQAVEKLPTDLAYAVVKAAKQAGLDTRRDGPFAKEVHRYYPNEDWHGGKADDIAVIVCIAVQDGAPVEEAPIKAKL